MWIIFILIAFNSILFLFHFSSPVKWALVKIERFSKTKEDFVTVGTNIECTHTLHMVMTTKKTSFSFFTVHLFILWCSLSSGLSSLYSICEEHTHRPNETLPQTVASNKFNIFLFQCKKRKRQQQQQNQAKKNEFPFRGHWAHSNYVFYTTIW